MGVIEEGYLEYLREQATEAAGGLFERQTGTEISETAVLEWVLKHLGVRLVDFGACLLGDEKEINRRDQKLFDLAGGMLGARLKKLRSDRCEKECQAEEVARLWKRPPKSVKKLQEMDPFDFEYWVAGYFKKRGFKNVVVTQFSGDFGIDVYMTCPNRMPAVVQCKRYAGSVGRPVIQQTYGAMHLVKARRCYVATSGRFAETARALEREHKDIVLLDGLQLLGK